MNRLLSIIFASTLFLGGTALAQSVEPPSLSGLGEAITGAVSDAVSDIAADVTGSFGSDSGGPGFPDPESGEDDTLDPESGNDETERRRLDLAVIGPVDTQGHVIVCKPLAAGGNPLEGLNVTKGGPKPKKTKICHVVSK